MPYLRNIMDNIKSICIYCGSATGSDSLYVSEAKALAGILVANNIKMINGGGSIGIMGVMADAMIAGGGESIGIIPQSLQQKELAHHGMTELIVVPDMHSRKQMMVQLADAFIALPGGFGTLDELFETLTWAQLGIHQKPIVVYNVNGFFDPMLAQADHMVKEGFLNVSSRALLMSTSEMDSLLPMLMAYEPPVSDKWTHLSSRV